MTNVAARNEARAIANGEAPHADTNDKVALYGMLARCLDLGTLQAVKLYPVHTFTDLEDRMADALRNVAFAGYANLSKTDIEAAERLFWARNAKARDMRNNLGKAALYGPERLRDGAHTAARREIITLRTIAREIEDGKTLSRNGLEASSRVPFSLAMLHLYDLNYDAIYHQEWYPQATGLVSIGSVYERNAVSFDYTNGLNLLVKPEPSTLVTRAAQPQIGCPATLVRGYIEEIHRLAATAAVEAGLLHVS